MRLRATRRVVLLLTFFCIAPVCSQVIRADELPSTESGASSSTGTPAERDRMFQEIAAEVALLERQGNLLKKVVRLVRPSVVHIEATWSAESRRQAGTRKPVEEAGSGVLVEIEKQIYVITNRHVVKKALLEDIRIQLADGRLVQPLQLWADVGTDIAVIRVAAEKLFPARIGDSKNVEIGDFVLAVGSPFGLSHSVTYGIISAKGRRDLELGDDGVRYQDFIQTDAAINPGNSGGPLLNLKGEVIGINTAIASNSGGNDGIGFTIPANMVVAVARQLVANGRVVRAFLGVQLDARFGPEEAAQLGFARPVGARVSGITPNSPAATANLLPGDLILKFDGINIEDDSHLVNLVSLTEVGRAVDVLLYRGGQQKIITVQVGDRSKFDSR